MRLKSALVATSLLSSTSAFLVAPGIAEAAGGAVEPTTAAWRSLLELTPQSVDVQCNRCPYVVNERRKPDGTLARIALEDVENTIHLEFSIHGNELQVNNETIFPLEAVNNNFPHVTAYQNRIDNNKPGIQVPVDFAVQVRSHLSPKHSKSGRWHAKNRNEFEDEDHELIPIEFTVLGLASTSVEAQSAHVDLIRDTTTGMLTLVRVKPSPFRPSSSRPHSISSDVCNTASNPSLCRLRAMISNTISSLFGGSSSQSMREWMGTHTSGGRPSPDAHNPDPHAAHPNRRPCLKGGKGKFGGKGFNGRPFGKDSHAPEDHPHSYHGHRHHHHNGGFHRVAHVLHYIVRTLIVPALLGFMGGLAASAIGMAVGQTIAWMWFKFGRGGVRGGEYRRASNDEENVDDKDDLPRYEDGGVEALPAYEESKE